MTYKDLQDTKKFRFHHTGSCLGYISRRTDLASIPAEHIQTGRYKGLYRVYLPRWDTTSHIRVDYFEAV